MLFDAQRNLVGTAQQEFPQSYPRPGWVEQDPMEIWACQSAVIRQVLEMHRVHDTELAALGISNQRETTIVWEKETGNPIYPAIVWQDKRTSAHCQRIRSEGMASTLQERTGLVVDSYFSATKLSWILDNVSGARDRAERGELLFGTVDSWLIWNMSGGRAHVTDYSNASRTMLFNIHKGVWDPELLAYFRIPSQLLPEVRPSMGVLASTEPSAFGGASIPIAGVAGDQQAALFGQGCWSRGLGKNTYGTGSFILMNTGTSPISSDRGLLTTIAWSDGQEITYALEGSVFITGAAVQWLRDELKVVRDARDTEYFAQKVPDSGGVYLIPAFSGLGAPYWDMYARGTIVGMTRGTSMDHIIRATLESIAYQVRDVSDLMASESGIPLENLRVDGGASANDFLMQFQADILGVPVTRPRNRETTALGAALLGGIGSGFWDLDNLNTGNAGAERIFVPRMEDGRRAELYEGWKRAVQRSLGWAADENAKGNF